VLNDFKSGDNNKEPEWFKQLRGYQPHALPGELYDLRQDPSERENQFAAKPEIVSELKDLLDKYKREGRSTIR
jgi:arylsulfatase A